jgi:hypothetical protein
MSERWPDWLLQWAGAFWPPISRFYIRRRVQRLVRACALRGHGDLKAIGVSPTGLVRAMCGYCGLEVEVQTERAARGRT